MFRREEDEAALYSLNSEGSVAMQQELRQFLNRRTDYRAGLVGVNVGEWASEWVGECRVLG